jgi:hypothetical protein
MCGKQRNGIGVKEDRLLGLMRWFKRNVTRDEKRNRLVVCRECYPAHKKKRDRYTSRQALYLAVGAIFAVLGLAMSFNGSTLTLSVLLIAALYILSLLNYTPALSIKPGAEDVAKNRSNK